MKFPLCDNFRGIRGDGYDDCSNDVCNHTGLDGKAGASYAKTRPLYDSSGPKSKKSLGNGLGANLVVGAFFEADKRRRIRGGNFVIDRQHDWYVAVTDVPVNDDIHAFGADRAVPKDIEFDILVRGRVEDGWRGRVPGDNLASGKFAIRLFVHRFIHSDFAVSVKARFDRFW